MTLREALRHVGLAKPARHKSRSRKMRDGVKLRMRKKDYLKVRRHVFQRDGGRCLVCGTTDDLTADHIIPVALGGSYTFDNLQTLCGLCNLNKGLEIRDHRIHLTRKAGMLANTTPCPQQDVRLNP